MLKTQQRKKDGSERLRGEERGQIKFIDLRFEKTGNPYPFKMLIHIHALKHCEIGLVVYFIIQVLPTLMLEAHLLLWAGRRPMRKHAETCSNTQQPAETRMSVENQGPQLQTISILEMSSDHNANYPFITTYHHQRRLARLRASVLSLSGASRSSLARVLHESCASLARVLRESCTSLGRLCILMLVTALR